MEDHRNRMLPRGGVVIKRIPFGPIFAEALGSPGLGIHMAEGYSRSALDKDLREFMTSRDLAVFQVFGEKQPEGFCFWISIFDEPPDHL